MTGAPSLSQDARRTAALLVEALPYIRAFSGKVVVVKYGGNALAGEDPGAGADDGGGGAGGGAAAEGGGGAGGGADAEAAALAAFAEDVVLLRSVGLLPGGRPRRRPPDRRADGPPGQAGRIP